MHRCRRKIILAFFEAKWDPFCFLFRVLKKKKDSYFFLFFLTLHKNSFRFDLSYSGSEIKKHSFVQKKKNRLILHRIFQYASKLVFRIILLYIFCVEAKTIFLLRRKKFLILRKIIFCFSSKLIFFSFFTFFTSFCARFTSDFFYFISMLNKQKIKQIETIFPLISFILLRNQKRAADSFRKVIC